MVAFPCDESSLKRSIHTKVWGKQPQYFGEKSYTGGRENFIDKCVYGGSSILYPTHATFVNSRKNGFESVM